jgi:flagellin-like protein
MIRDAVSPVVGVILMVAITVILAAIIAALVFGMAHKLVYDNGPTLKEYILARTQNCSICLREHNMTWVEGDYENLTPFMAKICPESCGPLELI